MTLSLVVFQDLTRHQANILADVIQLAECIDGHSALLGNRLQRLTFFHLVEVYLRCK